VSNGVDAFDTTKVHEALLNNLQQDEDWMEVEDPQPGDIVLTRTSGSGKFFNHLGVYIGKGKFIHTYAKAGGVVIDRVNSPFWKNRIKGYYRCTRKPSQ